MKYKKDLLKQIYSLKASGEYNDKEIQEIVGINADTWHTWKKNKPEFSELLKKADSEFIEFKLKKAARKGLKILLEGKEFEETTIEYKLVKDKDGNEVAKKVGEKRVKKFIMPNAISVIFALKNSDPENFKDKQEHEIFGKDGKPIEVKETINYEKLSDAALREIINAAGPEKGKG